MRIMQGIYRDRASIWFSCYSGIQSATTGKPSIPPLKVLKYSLILKISARTKLNVCHPNTHVGFRNSTDIENGLICIFNYRVEPTSAKEVEGQPVEYMVGKTQICSQVPGLSSGQRKLCQLNQDHMRSVMRGAAMAVSECHHQFHSRRWNCSTVDRNNIFSPTIKLGECDMDIKYMNFFNSNRTNDLLPSELIQIPWTPTATLHYAIENGTT